MESITETKYSRVEWSAKDIYETLLCYIAVEKDQGAYARVDILIKKQLKKLIRIRKPIN